MHYSERRIAERTRNLLGMTCYEPRMHHLKASQQASGLTRGAADTLTRLTGGRTMWADVCIGMNGPWPLCLEARARACPEAPGRLMKNGAGAAELISPATATTLAL
ncbi:unnamed protein product [Lota lota]